VQKSELAMPYKGFYVIVPPEYKRLECLPPEQFVPQLMNHLKLPYYVGLLSAAQYHGAGHQRPQIFQVMLEKGHRPIHCGKVRVEFAARRKLSFIPVQTFNTPRGEVVVSTAESTAIDAVGYYHRIGGIDQTATLLAELIEKIDFNLLGEC
jgi:predicted transcriptional regulator of viral defense system